MLFLRNHELAVRTEERGGPVAAQVELGPGDTLVGKSRVILLIHGYCNDLADARQSYSFFTDNFSHLGKPLTNYLQDVHRFYWPGDKTWGWLRFASYSWEIGPARQSALVLAAFLRELPTVTDIYLIAHSLGNRLLLELLQEFVSGGLPLGVQVKGICMMAAAVPVSAVRPSGDLHGAAGLSPAVVLFSPGDIVLSAGFALGESLAFDAAWPEAVGLHGLPVMQWPNRKAMKYGPNKNKEYNHPDYWLKAETCDPVASFLDSNPPKTLSEAAISSYSPQPPNVLVANVIAKHRTPIRF
jgi:hypothetical protein